MDEDIKKIPVCNDGYDKIVQAIPYNAKVLDIGANHRKMEQIVKDRNSIYKSMDVNKKQYHNYYSLERIGEKFDCILLFKVVEHLEYDEFLYYMSCINGLLKENGKIIVIIPNVFGFHYFNDRTHKQFYSHHDLYDIFKENGYKDIEVYRLSGKVFRFSFLLPLLIARHLFRLAYIYSIPRTDYTENILLIARK